MRPELQEIVDGASRLLHADVTLEDRDFNLVAFGSQRLDVDPVRQASILRRYSTRPIREWFEQFGISTSTGPLRTPPDPAQEIRSRLCFPVRFSERNFGYLWALDQDTDLDDPVIADVVRLAQHAGAHLAQLSRRHQDDAFLVSDLLSADVDTVAGSVARIEDRGLFPSSAPLVAVVVTAWGSQVSGLALNLWSLPRQVLADRGPQATTLLVPLRDDRSLEPAREAASLALQLYEEALPDHPVEKIVAGVGAPRDRIGEVRGSWKEARTAARVAGRAGAADRVACWPDLGLYRLLAAGPDAELARALVDEPVRRLLDSPDPAVARTVLAFLDRAGNVQETANALHIHRQTLYARLAKAEAVTGLTLGSGQHRLRLHAGLTLAPLLD